MTDVRDWLGGWPYEHTTPAKVQNFFGQRGFTQINLKNGRANTEYLFTRQNYSFIREQRRSMHCRRSEDIQVRLSQGKRIEKNSFLNRFFR